MNIKFASGLNRSIASIVLRQMRQSMVQLPTQQQTIEMRSVEHEYEQVLASDPGIDRELEVLELMVAGCTNVARSRSSFLTTIIN